MMGILMFLGGIMVGYNLAAVFDGKKENALWLLFGLLLIEYGIILR